MSAGQNALSTAAPAAFAYIVAGFNALLLMSALLPAALLCGLLGWPLVLALQLTTEDELVRGHVARARRSLGFQVLFCAVLLGTSIGVILLRFGLSAQDVEYIVRAVQASGIEVLLTEGFWKAVPTVVRWSSGDSLLSSLFVAIVIVALTGIISMCAGAVSLIRNIVGMSRLGERQRV